MQDELTRFAGADFVFDLRRAECRAWTIEKIGRAAAAGAIHSDIETNSLRPTWCAENLLAAGSWSAAKEKGQVRLEGREYVVKDGDVIVRHSG